MCFCSSMSVTAVVTAASSQRLPWCLTTSHALLLSIALLPSPHATSNLSPSHSRLSFTFALINSFFPSNTHPSFFCPLFCPFHTRPSLLVFNLQPPHLLCGFSLSFVMLPSPTVHCLCLYGNPAWTGVAKRSVRH